MKSILNYSSLSKKYVMALAGIFLMSFLVIHLAINLCLLRDDGGEWFNAAAHFMGTNYIIKFFEIFLFAGILIHILMGIILQIQNWMSRPVGYKKCNKSTTSFFSKYMIYTGAVVLVFFIIHFINFYFMKMGWVEKTFTLNGDEPDFYKVALALFANSTYSILYIVLICILGFHLNHAFQAAFQTLGLNHPVYTPFIKKFGTVYSILIVIGFNIIPVYFLFF
ncbi:MAG: succinate dehydrogenase cytochrome b subunit [Bacteroidales bacterium]